jgi:tetratricopeptide (TPR) repeat protein
MDPKDGAAYVDRGNAYLEKKLPDRAIQDYEEALRLNSKNSIAYNNRGVAYYRKKQYDRAIEDYTRAVQLNPNYAQAFANRALAYEDRGRQGDQELARLDRERAVRLGFGK